MADYIPPEMDPAQKEAIDAIHKRAMAQTPDTIAQATMLGTEGSQGFLGQTPAVRMRNNAVDGNQDPAMLDAIAQRSQRKFDNSQRDLGIKSKQEAMDTSMQRKAKAGELLQKEQELNENIKAMKAKAAADAKAARAATIGSIIGIGGAVAGAYAGGPAGAAAGYQIGSGVGTMAAQNNGG